MSDIAVHNGFGVFATQGVTTSRCLKFYHKIIFHSYDYDFKASIKKSNCFLYKL